MSLDNILMLPDFVIYQLLFVRYLSVFTSKKEFAFIAYFTEYLLQQLAKGSESELQTEFIDQNFIDK